MKLHEKIYMLRTEKNLSQGDLAEILDVSRQSVSKWETGASVPDLDKLIKMSDLFGVSIDYLVREEMTENEQKTAENDQKTEEKGENSQNVVVIKESLPMRKLVGVLLFAGAVISLFFAWPLAVFLAVLGGVCFAFKKHTLLWCAWVISFCTDIVLAHDTVIGRDMLFSAVAYSEFGVRMMIPWGYFLLLVALIAWTVFTFREVRFEFTKRKTVSLILDWIVFLAVIPFFDFVVSYVCEEKARALMESVGGDFVGSESYEAWAAWTGFAFEFGWICEWIQIIGLPILLILTIAFFRDRCEKKERVSDETT